jgi:hypothetical protein
LLPSVFQINRYLVKAKRGGAALGGGVATSRKLRKQAKDDLEK